MSNNYPHFEVMMSANGVVKYQQQLQHYVKMSDFIGDRLTDMAVICCPRS